MFTRDKKKKTIAATGASLALVAAMVGVGLTSPSTSAWAAAPVPGIEQLRQADPAPKPSPKPGRQDHGPRGGQGQQQRGQMQEAYLNALAGRLGVSADQLTEAMKQARIDLVNQAVAEGRLDQERANRMIQAIQSGQGPMRPGGGQARPGQGERGQQGPRNGQGPRGGPGMMAPGGKVITDTLGMTPQELRTEFQAGKSLAQIAEAKGVSRDTLKAKLIEAHKARIDAAVAAGRMTAEQAQKANERVSANIDQMLDRTPEQRPQRQQGATGS